MSDYDESKESRDPISDGAQDDEDDAVLPPGETEDVTTEPPTPRD